MISLKNLHDAATHVGHSLDANDCGVDEDDLQEFLSDLIEQTNKVFAGKDMSLVAYGVAVGALAQQASDKGE